MIGDFLGGMMVHQLLIGRDQRDALIDNCPGINNLVSWLDSIDRRPGLDELEVRLKSSDFNLDALKSCIGSTDDGYQRNVIKRTENYELVAICWKPGQITPIHDHIGSDCAFIILDGVSTERTFQINEDGLAVQTSSRNYVPGEVCAADEPDIHQVINEQDSELVNLHVYTPPLSEFTIYTSGD